MTENATTPDTNTANEITLAGKITAGILLIFLTTAAIYLVIAFWPNKMPAFNQSDDAAWYKKQCFNITLIEKEDSQQVKTLNSIQTNIDTLEKRIKDSAVKADPAVWKSYTDSLQKLIRQKKNLEEESASVWEGKKIHLNTILLILVALMGFLGNMIHVATSFTTFVGNGTFKRSWVLWYFVKPFTAAALAIIIYFIIRAGFLSYGSGASGVSLYGMMALAALAGLFTDNATLKLKEVFDVIFRPKDERTDKLRADTTSSVTGISPTEVPAAGDSVLVLTGKNLNAEGIKITIDAVEVKPSVQQPDKIEIKFTPAEPALTAKKAVLLITDKTGKTLFTKDIGITA